MVSLFLAFPLQWERYVLLQLKVFDAGTGKGGQQNLSGVEESPI